jgi:hypothetical protein
MNRFVIMMMAVSLTIYIPAICEEIMVPKGPAIGFSMGQRAGDVSIGLDVTSPYFHFPIDPNIRNESAFRISGDLRLKKGIPVGGTSDSMEPYYATRVGYVGGIRMNNCIRMFVEIGGMAVFPTNALANSTNPHFGAYGNLGGEFFLGKNLLTKNVGLYFEIGEEVSGSGKARFDKLAGSPLMCLGPTACAGVRYYL